LKSFIALNDSSKGKSNKIIAIILGSVLLILGIALLQVPAMILGALFIYITLYNKKVIIDEKGVNIYYNAVFFKKSTFYPYPEYEGILLEGGDNLIMNIGFNRKGITNYYQFNRTDKEDIIHIIKKSNPQIIVRTIKPRRKKFI
jgi:hypothetical protein